VEDESRTKSASMWSSSVDARSPASPERSLPADLVLDGGGVKGIGLVGAVSHLEEAGYRFQRVAGTSAGAIVGALVAAGMPSEGLKALMREVDYRRFQDRGFLGRVPLAGKPLSLLLRKGIYRGSYLTRWLADLLAGLGVRTFGDLRITDDSGTSLRPEQRYRLVVMATDLSRGTVVRLPWDYARYGLDPDSQPVAEAVRASAAIPYFFLPVSIADASGGTSLLVDGCIVSDFPVDVFDRTDGRPPRWPTFGVKLSAHPEAAQATRAIGGPLRLGSALMSTVAQAQDQRQFEDPCGRARTIFVNTEPVRHSDFQLNRMTQERLYREGHRAAEKFLADWSWERYLTVCRASCRCGSQHVTEGGSDVVGASGR
jgi:NTE family protein